VAKGALVKSQADHKERVGSSLLVAFSANKFGNLQSYLYAVFLCLVS
jgi:hypothetical protein